MIFWRSNLKADFVERLAEFIANNSMVNKPYIGKTKYWSSYYAGGIEDESLAKEADLFYAEQCVRMTKDMGVHGFMPYEQQYWFQAYNNETTSHNIHTHFGKGALISWVHILKATDKKCFFFVDSYGERHYPEQEENDIFAFPSWAMHGVEPVEEDNVTRIIAAGNIILKKK